MKKKMEEVGVDLGRMNITAWCRMNGIEIDESGPNAICSGYERRVTNKEKELKLDHVDLLDITIRPVDYDKEAVNEGKIEDPGVRWFVGDLARRKHQGDLLTTSDTMNKYSATNAKTEQAKVYTLQALAGYLSGKDEVISALGLGMPQEEYWDDENDQDVIDFKKGIKDVEVTFNHPKFNKAEVIVRTKKVEFFCEGTAAAHSLEYSYDVKEDKLEKNAWLEQELKKGLVIVSGLGSTSDDYAIFDQHGLMDAGYFGVPAGSTKALVPYRRMLEREYGYKKDKTTLDKLLIDGEDQPHKNRMIPLREKSIPFFDSMLQKRIRDVREKLDANNIDIGDISAQYQTGGTTDFIKLLSEKDAPGRLKLASHINIKLSDTPHSDEARGYWILMKLDTLEEEKKNRIKLEDNNDNEV